MYRRMCYETYWILEKMFCPGLKYSQYLYEDKLFYFVNDSMDWIDLGCGRKILPDWRYDKELELVKRCKSVSGIDLDKNSIDKHRSIKKIRLGSLENIPFDNGQFDIASCNMVLEHVENPNIFFSEAFRILRPGGLLLLHTPNFNSYTTIAARIIPEKIKYILVRLLQGRYEDDLFRTYYKCNTQSEIIKYSAAAGFNVVDLSFWCSSAQFIVILPLVLIELLYLKFLMSRKGKYYRNNIFAVLRKPKYQET